MAAPTIYPITIQEHDTDYTHRASISTIIGGVLNVAGFDANAKGLGVTELNKDDLTWVLSRFSIELDYLPEVFEKLEISTWIGDYNRLVSTRNFSITDSAGAVVGGAVSQWCMLDIKSRRAIDLTPLHETYSEFVLRDLPSPIDRPRKIPSFEPQSTHDHKAAYSDIDFNKHVNSLRYLDLMLDMLPLSLIEKSGAIRVDLQYISECVYGDIMTVNYTQQENVAIFDIVRNGSAPAVKCMIEWR
ncbi:MAG: acyl-ACP thioesterase domain-containing protein [Rikenellaceae bacterium]